MARTPSAEVVRDVVQRNVRIAQDSCISTVRTTGMIFPDTHGRLHPKLRLCPAGHLATDY